MNQPWEKYEGRLWCTQQHQKVFWQQAVIKTHLFCFQEQLRAEWPLILGQSTRRIDGMLLKVPDGWVKIAANKNIEVQSWINATMAVY